jgi:two-component system sensor histidine kinase KdpD
MRRDGGPDVRQLLTGEYARAVALVALATAVALPLRSRLQTTDVAMLYLLPVVAVATRYSRGAALLTTVLGIALFDFLFVPPYYTFAVQEPAYFLTFLVMLAVAMVMSGLTARIREQAEEAERRERRTAALYAMSSELAPGSTRTEVLAVLGRHLTQMLKAQVTVVLAEDIGLDRDAPRWPASGAFESQMVRLAAVWTYRTGKASGQGTAHSAEAEALIVPLRSSTRVLGVIVAVPEPEDRVFDAGHCLTAELLADRAGLELDRTPAGGPQPSGVERIIG